MQSNLFTINHIQNVDWKGQCVATFTMTVHPHELEIRDCKLNKGNKGGFYVTFPDIYFTDESKWWTNDDGKVIKSKKIIKSTDAFQTEVLGVVENMYDHTQDVYQKYTDLAEMPL